MEKNSKDVLEIFCDSGFNVNAIGFFFLSLTIDN